MVSSSPAGPRMLAKVEKNIENISAVDIPRYSVWIRCHIVKMLFERAKVGIFRDKNYI